MGRKPGAAVEPRRPNDVLRVLLRDTEKFSVRKLVRKAGWQE